MERIYRRLKELGVDDVANNIVLPLYKKETAVLAKVSLDDYEEEL